MDWKMISFDERTEIDKNGRFKKYKEARFSVDGSEHTLKISMPDYDAGNTRALIQHEVDLISAALGKVKKG